MLIVISQEKTRVFSCFQTIILGGVMNTNLLIKDNAIAKDGMRNMNLTDSNVNVQKGDIADIHLHSKMEKKISGDIFGFKVQPAKEKVNWQFKDALIISEVYQDITLPAIPESEVSKSNSYQSYQWAGVILTGATLFLITGVTAGLLGLIGVPWLSLYTVKMLYAVGLIAGLFFWVLADELRPVKQKD
jgi:hypothetical protein